MTERRETWLVTGASSGIGATYADRLAARGHDLILVARRADRLREVAARAEAAGAAVEIIVADLEDDADLALVERRLRSGVDALINNAGFGYHAPFADADVGRLDALMQLNIRALVRLSHAALPSMLAAGRGTIVNIGSGVVYRHIPGYAVYSGSKAFVTAFTSGLISDYGDSGVRFQLAVPGMTRTEFASVAAGLGYEGIRSAALMEVDDFVDSALRGLGDGEVVTIPAMEEAGLHAALDEAREAVGAQVSSRQPASRYLPKARG